MVLSVNNWDMFKTFWGIYKVFLTENFNLN